MCVCVCVVHIDVKYLPTFKGCIICGCILFFPSDLEGICSKAQNQEGKRRGNDVYWNGKDKVCDCYFCTYVPEHPEQAFIHFNTVSMYVPSGKENKGE